MSIQVLIKLAEEFELSSLQADSNSIAHLTHHYAATIIDPNLGDELSSLKSSNSQASFYIRTASPNSHHLFRKLSHFLQSKFPTHNKSENDQISHSQILLRYPAALILLAIKGQDIIFKVEEV